MKKSGVLFVLFLLIVPVCFTVLSAQSSDQIPGLPAGLNVNQLQAANGKIINISTSSGYLAQQWRNILFSNPVFVWFDNAMHFINPVFVVFLAQNYAFSVSFLVTFVLWVFFFFSFRRIFDMVSLFNNKGVKIILAAGLTTVSAQIGLLGSISNWIVWLIWGTDKPWWFQWAIALGVILVIVIIYFVIKTFGMAIVKSRIENKRMMNDLKLDRNVKISDKFVKGLLSAFHRDKKP